MIMISALLLLFFGLVVYKKVLLNADCDDN